MTRLQRLVVYSAVAINGAAVMALELLGTRIVGGFYGTSLFVWGALISVTLVAMAVGYVIGGALAKRLALPIASAVASVLVALVPPLARTVLAATDGLGARSGALTSAALLFFLPIAALSMTGPVAISLLLKDVERSGKVSGTTLALSTAGSVVGTLLLAFILLPVMRTTVVIDGLAGILLAQAVVLWVSLSRPTRKREAIALLVCAIGTGGAWAQRLRATPETSRFDVRFEKENHYGRLRVVDDQVMSIRWMLQDSSLISAARRGDPRPVFEYLNLVEALLGLAPAAKSALVVGLGAGHVPRTFEGYGLEVDSIEINPAVVEAAKEYFGFAPHGRVVVGDARFEVRHLGRQYDFIVHDCFSGGTVPPHVLSLEMMEELRARLADDGILVTSFFGDTTGEDSRAAKTLLKTLQAAFPYVRVLVPRPDTQPIDIAFVASRKPIELGHLRPEWYRTATAGLLAQQLGELEISIDARDAEVALDDFNPLDLYQAKRAERYRAFLVEKLGVGLFL